MAEYESDARHSWECPSTCFCAAGQGKRVRVVSEGATERQRTIQGVREKAAELASEWDGRELAYARAYYNWEVCALLDEIDQLKLALSERGKKS